MRVGGTGRRTADGISTAVSVLILSASAGCAGPQGQFYIVQNQVPESGCVIPADKGSLYQGEGTLDVRVPGRAGDTAYLLFPLLQNDLPAEAQGGVEANRIALSRFDIDVKFVEGAPAVRDFFEGLAGDPATEALVRYQAPWSGSVEPGGGNTAAATNAFPTETARRLRDSNLLRDSSTLPDSNLLGDGSYAHVNVRIRAVGNTLTGRVVSDTFTYPLRICDGCLIHSVTTCPANGPVLQGGACNAAQDAPVDCCTSGAALICPATSAP